MKQRPTSDAEKAFCGSLYDALNDAFAESGYTGEQTAKRANRCPSAFYLFLSSNSVPHVMSLLRYCIAAEIGIEMTFTPKNGTPRTAKIRQPSEN